MVDRLVCERLISRSEQRGGSGLDISVHRELCEDRFPASDTLANLDSDIHPIRVRQDQFGTGSEFDHAVDPSSFSLIIDVHRADDPPCNEAGNLTDSDHLLVISLKHDEVVLVLHVTTIRTSIVMSSRDMAVELDPAMARPSIHMDIQNAQEDANDDTGCIQIRMMFMVLNTRDHSISRADHEILSPVIRKTSGGTSEEGIHRQQKNSQRDQNGEGHHQGWFKKQRDTNRGSEDAGCRAPFAYAVMSELDSEYLDWL